VFVRYEISDIYEISEISEISEVLPAKFLNSDQSQPPESLSTLRLLPQSAMNTRPSGHTHNPVGRYSCSIAFPIPRLPAIVAPSESPITQRTTRLLPASAINSAFSAPGLMQTSWGQTSCAEPRPFPPATTSPSPPLERSKLPFHFLRRLLRNWSICRPDSE